MEERLAHGLIKGLVDHIGKTLPRPWFSIKPLAVIEGPLMDGMNIVEDLLKERCSCLGRQERSRDEEAMACCPTWKLKKPKPAEGSGRVLMATVKGDVHDIGKTLLKLTTVATATSWKTWE